MSLFKRRRFPDEIIQLCVRWYCKYGISYRDQAEMMKERGVEIDPSTIFRWVQRYAPELEKRVRRYQGHRSGSWRVNCTGGTLTRQHREWRSLLDIACLDPQRIIEDNALVRPAEPDGSTKAHEGATSDAWTPARQPASRARGPRLRAAAPIARLPPTTVHAAAPNSNPGDGISWPCVWGGGRSPRPSTPAEILSDWVKEEP